MKTRVIGILSILLPAVLFSCQDDGQIEFNRYYSTGSTVYQLHCQNCHGAKGEGLQGLIPPLLDSAYLKNNKEQLACFIKNGQKGKIDVAGKQFEGEMPPNDLSPIEIAQVLTYITNSFGNKMTTINTQQVNENLAKCK